MLISFENFLHKCYSQTPNYIIIDEHIITGGLNFKSIIEMTKQNVTLENQQTLLNYWCKMRSFLCDVDQKGVKLVVNTEVNQFVKQISSFLESLFGVNIELLNAKNSSRVKSTANNNLYISFQDNLRCIREEYYLYSVNLSRDELLNLDFKFIHEEQSKMHVSASSNDLESLAGNKDISRSISVCNLDKLHDQVKEEDIERKQDISLDEQDLLFTTEQLREVIGSRPTTPAAENYCGFMDRIESRHTTPIIRRNSYDMCSEVIQRA